jgi:hypothetical protein
MFIFTLVKFNQTPGLCFRIPFIKLLHVDFIPTKRTIIFLFKQPGLDTVATKEMLNVILIPYPAIEHNVNFILVTNTTDLIIIVWSACHRVSIDDAFLIETRHKVNQRALKLIKTIKAY